MGTHPIFESDFDCLTEMKKSRLGFGQLCTQDKLRLQTLITELSKANEALKSREERIDELEAKLNLQRNAFDEVNSAKSDSDEKAKRTKNALERFRTEISSQQTTIERQIRDAMGQVNSIKERRRKEQKRAESKEAELRRQIDFHIETARSTESKADRIQSELEKLKQKESTEISIQTSLIVEKEEKTEEKEEEEESAWQVKLRSEQLKLEMLIEQQGALLNKAVSNLERLEQTTQQRNFQNQQQTTPTTTPRSTTTTISTLPSNLAKLIADIELDNCEPASITTDQSMTRLVDLIDELDLDDDFGMSINASGGDTTSGDVSEIRNIIFEPELEELFFK